MRLTATTRFQRKLGQLLDQRKASGDKAPKGTLADYCGRDAQSWVSNMLSEARATQPNLEDLENIADFFRVSVNELFRPANPKDLSADEQRILLAFRSIPPIVQTHFLAILEAASLNANMSVGNRLRQLKTRSITTEVDAAQTAPSDELTRLRNILTRISIELAAALASDQDHQPPPSAPLDTPERGKVGA